MPTWDVFDSGNVRPVAPRVHSFESWRFPNDSHLESDSLEAGWLIWLRWPFFMLKRVASVCFGGGRVVGVLGGVGHWKKTLVMIGQCGTLGWKRCKLLMVKIVLNAKAGKKSILGGVPKHHRLDIYKSQEIHLKNHKKYHLSRVYWKLSTVSFFTIWVDFSPSLSHQLSTHTKTLVSTDSTKPPLSLCTGRTGWLGTSPGATRRGGGNSASM